MSRVWVTMSVSGAIGPRNGGAVRPSLVVALVFIPLCVYLTLPSTVTTVEAGWYRKAHQRVNDVLRWGYEATFGRLNRIYNRLLAVSLNRRFELILGALVRALAGLPPVLPGVRLARPLTRKLVSRIGWLELARVRLLPEGLEPLAVAEERLIGAVGYLACAEAAFATTMDFIRDRKAFGQAVADFQNTRFKLADMRTRIDVAQTFVDRCVMDHNEGKLTAEVAAEAKLFTSELEGWVTDECLQLHGGAG